MTRGQYYVAKEDYRIGSDIEARAAIDFVLALLGAEKEDTTESGPELPEKAEVLEALETAKDIVEGLLHDAEEFSDEEASA